MCITGQQPQCYDGTLINTMSCQVQSVQTCQFPPNGGCDPHTHCSDATNLFGTKLVQCSACPTGYYGSGRSGCYDINECTVVLNGYCDPHTSCNNFDGGFNCSSCEGAKDPMTGKNLGLVGNPNLKEGPGCQPKGRDDFNKASLPGKLKIQMDAGTCTGSCPADPCDNLEAWQLQDSTACDAKAARGCDCKYSAASSGRWFWITMAVLLPVCCTAAICHLCSKKQYKTEGGFEKVDVGSIGTGPSIYDFTWAR